MHWFWQHTQTHQSTNNHGFALFYAVVVVAVISSLGAVLSNLIIRESSLTASARQSSQAFYATDAGMECGLYWDQNQDHFPRGGGSPSDIECAGQSSITVSEPSNNVYSFSLDSTQGAEVCADVTVEKGTTSDGRQLTRIESLGRDTCASGTRVERALRTTY